eukprot:scaffold74069_cov43-Prasinocladus_malaysianus.AAC.1
MLICLENLVKKPETTLAVILLPKWTRFDKYTENWKLLHEWSSDDATECYDERPEIDSVARGPQKSWKTPLCAWLVDSDCPIVNSEDTEQSDAQLPPNNNSDSVLDYLEIPELDEN